MESGWVSKPENAWTKYILPDTYQNEKWVEDSVNISQEIALSKRELFSLIIIAHACNQKARKWRVGYNQNDYEPNDGFIINGKRKIQIEHKVIAQFEKKEVLSAIINTYNKYAKKGSSYGKNRVLVIQPNKQSDHGGLIKISDLTKSIGDNSPFDQVLTLGLVSIKNNIGFIHLINHYPRHKNNANSGSGIIQIDFNLLTGEATVPHSGFTII